MQYHLKIFSLAVFFILTLIACSETDDDNDIPLSSVPANIITIVQNTLPGISLSEAEKHHDDDIIVYELEGKLINNKKYEVEIADDGTILKIELED